MISLELASIAPKRIKSLSLLATTRGKYVEDLRSREPLRQSVYAKDPSIAVANLLELLYPRDAITETRVDETDETQYDTLFKFHMESRKSQAIQPSTWAMVSQLLAIRTHFVSNARLLAINDCGFPVLIVTGMKDILIPPAESICLREHMTGDHVHTLFIENAGHGVTLQFVAEVVQALAATFQRNSC
jgi:pimeloyl-ACP methyl ester carboxylesterase